MATISFTTAFNLAVIPKQFKFEDTADYAGQGIALLNVNGNFKITAPSGSVIYNNTDFSDIGCDIRNFTDRENQTVIQLPLATNGFPEVGAYLIEYTVYNNNLLTYSTVTNTYTYNYVQPVICIEQTVDCISPLFTSTDATDYVVAGVSPTLVRAHTVTFPVGSGLSPATGPAAVLSFGFEQFANGTQTTEINSELEYLFPDGLTVIDEITAYKEILVDCTFSCSVYCGLKSIYNQMNAARIAGATTEYNRLALLFSLLMALKELAEQAIACGKSDDVNGILETMRTIGNFTDDCCCEGDEPSLVTGLGNFSQTVVVDSCGYPITVTPVTVGNTTTYTVCFNEALLATILGLYNTIVLAGTNVLSVVDSGIIAGVRTFTVNGLPLPAPQVADGESSAITDSVTSATYVPITDATVTIPVDGDGDYLFWGEIVARMKTDTRISVTYYKNAAPIGLSRTWGTDTTGGTTRSDQSLCINEKLTGLVAGDVITLQVQRDAGADPVDIFNQSIQYLRK